MLHGRHDIRNDDSLNGGGERNISILGEAKQVKNQDAQFIGRFFLMGFDAPVILENLSLIEPQNGMCIAYINRQEHLILQIFNLPRQNQFPTPLTIDNDQGATLMNSLDLSLKRSPGENAPDPFEEKARGVHKNGALI